MLQRCISTTIVKLGLINPRDLQLLNDWGNAQSDPTAGIWKCSQWGPTPYKVEHDEIKKTLKSCTINTHRFQEYPPT